MEPGYYNKILVFLSFLKCVALGAEETNFIFDYQNNRNQNLLKQSETELKNLPGNNIIERQSESFLGSLFSWSNLHLGDVDPLFVPDWYLPRVSEHFLDPYSFTHVIHGYIFYYLGGDTFKEMPSLGFSFAVAIETLWEIFENSDFVIDRYRDVSGTSRLHAGDSVLNIVGDLLSCSVGYWIAAVMDINGMGWVTLALAIISEVGLIFYMRSNFFLVTMLNLFPVDSITSWQEKGIPEEFRPVEEISDNVLRIEEHQLTEAHEQNESDNDTRIKTKMIFETLIAVLFNAYMLSNSDTPYYLREDAMVPGQP